MTLIKMVNKFILKNKKETIKKEKMVIVHISYRDVSQQIVPSGTFMMAYHESGKGTI